MIRAYGLTPGRFNNWLKLFLVVEFEASDSGYSTSSVIVWEAAAESLAKTFCERNDLDFMGLGVEYEVTDDNGFFYSFTATEAVEGASVSTGQWR